MRTGYRAGAGFSSLADGKRTAVALPTLTSDGDLSRDPALSRPRVGRSRREFVIESPTDCTPVEQGYFHSMLWSHATGSIALDKPCIVGIVNVTPDSFSDGGLFRNVDDARRQMDRLVEEGTDVLDIGGESTRPQGASEVSAEEELTRILPVIEAARADHPAVPVSVDTTKSAVARAALDAGASIVNDVSAFRLDAEMPRVCAEAKAGVVLMHSRGGVTDMATFVHANYETDVVGEVIAELEPSFATAKRAGIERDCVVLDPGIGFSKRGEHSLAVLAGVNRFVALGFPVLVGVSRKRFIGEVTGTVIATERVWGTVGANVAALVGGARLFRVHDVRPNRHALDVAWAIMSKSS